MEAITLAHGSGGSLSRKLIQEVILPQFDNPVLAPLADAALLEMTGSALAFTTDGFVVKPVFFPGGNIGKLAVCGTVNDLAVMGVVPRYLSCAVIIEEGFPLARFRRIISAMRQAALKAKVQLVTGDTKVVERGGADGIFIVTAGIGARTGYKPLPPQAGDLIVINGGIAEHGAAIMAAREGLLYHKSLQSDCAPLAGLIQAALKAAPGIKFMRDPTRGGVATVLNEIAAGQGFGIEVNEAAVPLKPQVASFCSILGFDPLYIANEGKVIFVVPAAQAEALLAALRRHPLGREAAVIGSVTAGFPGKVYLKTGIGGKRILDLLAGDQLPRIC